MGTWDITTVMEPAISTLNLQVGRAPVPPCRRPACTVWPVMWSASAAIEFESQGTRKGRSASASFPGTWSAESLLPVATTCECMHELCGARSARGQRTYLGYWPDSVPVGYSCIILCIQIYVYVYI